MIDELIERIGQENLTKDTVNMKDSLYIKINKDREINKNNIILVHNKVEMKDLEMSKWFKEREKYSNYIESNKAIVPVTKNKKYRFPKIIMSCTPYAIIFNYTSLGKKIDIFHDDIKHLFKDMANEYLKILGYNELNSYYISAFDKLYNYINDNNIKTKILKIKIFLDVPIEEYKEQYEIYIKNKLFNQKDTILKKFKDDNYGRVCLFTNLNSDKPLLSRTSYVNNEISILSTQEALNQLNFKKYLGNQSKDKLITLKYGSNVGSFNYKTVKDSKGKGHSFITEYFNNPYQVIENLKIPIYIENILNYKFTEEKILYKYSDLIEYIRYLVDLNKKYTSKNDAFYNIYEQYFKDLNNTNFDIFKCNFKNILNDILRIHLTDESIKNVILVLNFQYSMYDYLFNTNIKKENDKMINEIKNKILESDKLHNYKEIESPEEFYILCGQLVKYIKQHIHTDEITNKVYYDYNVINLTKQLMDILQKDFERYSYDEHKNCRANKILTAINIYYVKNINILKKINKIIFNIGMYNGECLLYISNKNNNEKINNDLEGEN